MINWHRLWYIIYAKGNLPAKIPSKVMRAEGWKVKSKYLMRWNLSPRLCIYIQVNAWPLTFQGSNCRKLDKVGANADNKYGNINQLAVIHFWWPLHFGCRLFRFIEIWLTIFQTITWIHTSALKGVFTVQKGLKHVLQGATWAQIAEIKIA